ncbi:MAG: hypothetical protein JXQ96_08755 [Cyclobacteriaceae bacterium]
MEFRIARHTNYLNQVIDFYTNILALEILFSFENHNDYSEVFIGKPGLNWHFEFTESLTPAEHKQDAEDFLVFYPTEKNEYDQIIANIEAKDILKIKPKNPFWVENGVLINDPDGFGIIISNFKIR